MLVPVDDGPAVVACNSCRFSEAARSDDDGMTGGGLLAAALRRVAAGDPAYARIAVQEMPCLFACERFCTVHLRGPGRIGYVLGGFAPNDEAARAILDYAVAYAESAEGQVPYRDWPEGVKGHFITRMPPAGFVVE